MKYETELKIYYKDYKSYKELFYIFFMSNIILSILSIYTYFTDKNYLFCLSVLAIMLISNFITYKRMRNIELLMIGLYISHLDYLKDLDL